MDISFDEKKYVSRGGLKLEHALQQFKVSVAGKVCFDVGSSTGGFVDCLLQNGAEKIYSLDTAYGELAWKLRQNSKVVVIEKTNILHFSGLPEKVDLVTIDVTFTPLVKILPIVKENLKDNGEVVALLKPQYENSQIALKHKGVVPDEDREKVLQNTLQEIQNSGWKILGQTLSPILGGSGNTEYLIRLGS